MITAAIGKIFLSAYNERHHTNYDAKRFFTEIYFPLFFGHDKYLMWPTNSPFVQQIGKVSGQNGYGLKKVLNLPNIDESELNDYLKHEIPKGSFILSSRIKKRVKDTISSVEVLRSIIDEDRKNMLNTFFEKLSKCHPDASIAIGYPAAGITETTSGQVTNIDFTTTINDICCSWFGSSLGVGVGDKSILFTDKRILMDIYEGWFHYRDIINNTTMQRGNQVNTWNGQWLRHRYSREFNERKPLANINITSINSDGSISVISTSWTQVLIGIARHFSDDLQLIGYVYNIGKTNITLGFLPFFLNHIRRPVELYQEFFGIKEGIKAETLWGGARGFTKCCQAGAIGLKAMEPKALKGTWDNSKLRCNFDNEKEKLNFNTYKIWLMALLNSKEMWDESLEFAKALQDYLSNKEKRLNTARNNKVEDLLNARSKRAFIAAATEIMDDEQIAESLSKIVQDVHMMPDDNVPYFITLIRFNKLALDKKQ